MQIGYANPKLERICTKRKAASKHLPSQIKPELLIQRIGELGAFDNLGEIPFQAPPLHFHPVRETLAGAYAVTIRGLWRIVFVPDGEFERREDGTAIEETVTEITIHLIEDYHR